MNKNTKTSTKEKLDQNHGHQENHDNINIQTKGYKKTEVGVIPEDWNAKELGKIGNFVKGKGIKKDEVLNFGIPCVRYGELYTVYNNLIHNTSSYISEATAKESYKLNYGDLLFAGSGETKEDIGKSAIILREDTYAGGDIVIFRTQNIDSVFLGYISNMEEVNKQKSLHGQGDAVVHIYASGLSKVKIPLPPTLTEQKAIAQVLSDTDALIQALEKKIAKKKLIKKGVMQKLLTPKEGWEVKTLGEIFTFYSTSNFSKAEMSLEGEVGCIHYGLIHAINNANYPLSRGVKYYVSQKQAKYEFLQEGDIVMVDASEDLLGLNKSVEITDLKNKECIAGLHTFHLRDKESIYVNFFRGLVLNSIIVKRQMLSLAVGMKVFGVSKLQLQKITLPVPPIDEQTRIAKIHSDIDTEIEQLEQKLSKYKQAKQGMMQQLLTGKIRLNV